MTNWWKHDLGAGEFDERVISYYISFRSFSNEKFFLSGGEL